jgi:hypothetical protein
VSDADTTLDERDAQALLERYVEAHVAGGAPPPLAPLCAERPELLPRLRALVAAYHAVGAALAPVGMDDPCPAPADGFPQLAGLRVMERLGRGGGGDVYKVEDLTLGRVVAAKVLRRDSALAATLPDFLREARSLALFDDPRIVRLLELRTGEPTVLLMEYVDGFTLAEIGPSLEYAQRARLILKLASALERAHALGLQHRDIKPANVLVDARLEPKLLDFGVSGADPHRGHGLGTLAYMAPEQLDPRRPIDARTDVYALGVVLYELLCGVRPYEEADSAALIARIRDGRPRLPVEVDPRVPEPLQAIALTAMAASPADRYASAREMALDLERWLDGRPVLARPVAYRSALARRVEPHLEQIAEWERLRLIYPHEGDRLRAAYGRLTAREDDWIVHGRVLSLPQIALYVGAFLLFCGSVLAVVASMQDAVHGVAWPLLALGVPCLGLHLAAHRLYQGAHKAAAVAFHLGAAVLVPSLLLIVFREQGWWAAVHGAPFEMFAQISNRQLQIAVALSCLWAAALAERTHTVALSSGFTFLLALFHLTVIADRGLRSWIEDGQWHRVGLHLLPLIVITGLLGSVLEHRRRPWFAEPLYVAAGVAYVLSLELLALNGKALSFLGVTLGVPGDAAVSDPTRLDTVAALTLNGLLFYAAAALFERRGSPLQQRVAPFLYVLTPFAILEPLAHLSSTGEYPRRYDWIYLAFALGVAFASRWQQRRSFYYAGLVNAAVALWLITDHYHWNDRPAWTVVVVLAGAALLAAGLALDWRQSRSRAAQPSIRPVL